MANTQVRTEVSDVIKVPSLFTEYVGEEVINNSDLIRSSAVQTSNLMNDVAKSASTTADIPFNKQLSGRSQAYTEGTIEVNKLNSGVQKAVATLRANAWGSTDLATELSGDDKMGAISRSVGQYWANDKESTVSLMLTGIFGAATMSDNVVSFEYESEDNLKDEIGKAVIAAEKSLGKNGKKLKVIYCGGAIVAAIQQSNLYTTVRDPADANISIDMFLGKYQIVQSDSLGEMDMFLFGEGAIQYGDGTEALGFPTELERDARNSTSNLINRQKDVFHLNGVSYTGTIAGESAVDSELENPANWTRVYEQKNVLAVKIEFSEADAGA